MNLAGIAGMFRLSQLFDGGHPRDPAVARMFSWGSRTASGELVNEDVAMTLSAVYAAVRLISESIGSLPLIVYRESSSGRKEKATSHPAYSVLHDSPNADMTSIVYRETAMAHVLLWGKHCSEILFDMGGNVRGLYPLEPWRVVPEYDKDTKRLVFRVDGKRTVEAADMLYIPGLGFNGVTAKSVIGYARESLGHTLATEKFGQTFFGNGARFSGILRHPGKLSDKAYQRLREENSESSGAGNAHRLKVLEEGMEFKETGVNPDDAQFLETRQFQTNEIARWFNVPPHMLKDLSRATFSNIEHQSVEFVVYCLRPWLTRWEQELNRKLLGRGFFAKFNVEGLLRGDSKSRAEFYRIMHGMGVYSINDILELEDRNPIGPDGDKRLVQTSLTTLEKIGEDPPPAPPDPDARDDERDDPMDDPREKAMRAACQDLLNDSLGRMLRKESKAAEHAAKSPGTFLAWMDTFYADHQGAVLAAIKPAFVALSRIEGFSPTSMASKYASAHCEKSRQDLLAASECSPEKLPESVAAVATRWLTERLSSLESVTCHS